MIKKATKNLLDKARNLLLPSKGSLTARDVEHAREYIRNYWQKLTIHHEKDDGSLIGVPHPYLIPSYEETHEYDFQELFYWDSFFMAQGVMDTEHKQLVIGIVEDLLSILERFGVIPNASRLYYTSRSQPPFLTTFIWQVHDAFGLDKPWLKRAMALAEKEYNNVWMGEKKPHARQIYRGLSRYYDFNFLHDIAETESGWDMTPRFNRKCMDYLPVDLNSLLYKYETDLHRYYLEIGEPSAAEEWEKRAAKRKRTMNELMWDDGKGMFYDFNYKKERRGTVNSLAAYYPLWAGLASEKQAKRLVANLRKFEQKGGLATTDVQPLNQFLPGSMPLQWAYPNGWAPLHFLVIQGLERYGYHEDARRIAMKWLKTNLDWFNVHHIFLEKYNVVAPDKPPSRGVYPSQTGFGWTNAVFEYFCQKYIDS